MQRMRAISLWQPWASLWLTDAKTIETRSWYTGVRGPVLVHAAKRIERDVDSELASICEAEFGADWRRTLPLGALVGRIYLEACAGTAYLSRKSSAQDLACGNFEPGRFGWIRSREVIEFVRPIPYRGQQGFFWVPESFLAA